MSRGDKPLRSKKSVFLTLFLCTLLLIAPFIQVSHPSITLRNSQTNVVDAKSKLSQPLLKLASAKERAHSPVDIIASLLPETEWSQAKRAILQTAAMAKIKAYHEIIHAISLQTTVGALFNLAGLPEIYKLWTDIGFQLESIEAKPSHQTLIPPNGYFHPKDVIEAEPLYSIGVNGSHTIVAILDTGIDSTHPDLDDMDDNETTNDPKVLAQVSFVEGDPFPFDLNGHGTYCAGLVAGTGAAANGNFTGIAPGAQLMSAKVLLGDGTGYSSWVIRGIEWSVANGADIILLPFSTLGMPGDPLSEAIRVATEKGVLIITAAGDRGPNHMTIMSPGESIAALTVGAYDSELGIVPDFSSRGPTFDMRTKPDLVAPGVNIISSSLYNIIPTEIGNISFPISPGDLNFLGIGGFGTPINSNYTRASTTSASAAITAGAACLLLQGNRFAPPEGISIGIRRGATPLQNEPNIEGAGLLNVLSAQSELQILHDPFPAEFRTRSVGIGLPYYGILMSESSTENVTLLMSGYVTAMAAVATSSITNLTMFHMLLGMFYLAVNDSSPLPFALLNVEQEFHWTALPYGNYIRATGILSYNDLLVIPRVESWQISTGPATNAFRISLFLINIGTETASNIRVYSLWNFDLFSGANDTSAQIGFFNSTSQLFHIYSDVLPPNETARVEQYTGIKGTTPFTGFEVGPYSEVSSRLQNETINGTPTFSSDEGVGFATQWLLGDLSAGSNAKNVSLTLGFGRNFTALVYGINETEQAMVSSPQSDLCMIRVHLPRTGLTNSFYETSIIVLNIGDLGIDSIAVFLTNRSQPMGGAIFARYFQLGIVEPFQYRELHIEWNPEVTDIYFGSWIVSPTIDFDFFPPSIPQDLYPLDNFVYRDVFISKPPQMRMLIPSFLPYGPMPLRYPNDYAIYNFTLITTTPIHRLTVNLAPYINPTIDTPIDRNLTTWVNPPTLSPSLIENIRGIAQFQVLTFIPTFIESGP
ncbi:MAG: S8 family serine peptidase, partial [Candidatus Thorarchaeota archaeon]